MRRAARFTLLLVTALLALTATTVLAAPVAFENVDVTYIEEQGSTVLLVAGQLPESAKLPAEIQIALPAGAQLQWAGELMGSDGSGDFEIPYKKTTANGTDVYTMTLTKSRIGQIEALVPAVTTSDGTNFTTDVSWVPFADAPSARISVRVPANASITAVAEGETARLYPADQAYSYFSKTVEDVKAGSPLTLGFSYKLGAAPASSGGSGGDSNGLLIALILAVAVGIFVLAGTAIRKKAAGVVDESDDDDEEAAESFTAEPAAAPAAEAHADIAEDLDEDDDPLVEAEPRRLRPQVIVLVGVVAVAVFVGVLAGNRSTTAQNVGGALTRTYGTAEACTKATLAYTPASGVDVTEQGGAILTALEAVPGIGSATIMPQDGVIEIGYCDSSATENDLRAVLNATGLVTVEAAAAPAPSAEAPSAEATTAE